MHTVYVFEVEIFQESKYKDFLRKFVGENFTSYHKFSDEYSDFIKPSHLSQILKINKAGQYLYPKEISFSKWVSWINTLGISKKEKKHLILLRLKDELLKDLSSSSDEAKLIEDLIAQNLKKAPKAAPLDDLNELNSSKFNGNLFDIVAAMGQLNKNRFKYLKDTLKSCILEEIATKPSIKTIELKQLLKKIF